MSTEFKHRMLRCIAQQPRPLIFFTDGDVHATVSARHIEGYAADMVAEGLVFLKDDRYFITEAGKALLNKPTTMAAPRIWCAASVSASDPYRPPAWSIRAGADQHKQYSSRGV